MPNTYSADDVLNGALLRKFRQLEDAVAGAHLLEAALEGAEEIRAEAEALAPRGSKRAPGRDPLHENIAIEVVEAKREKAVLYIGPRKRAYHGAFLELGTVKMGARPWLRPAFDARKEQAQRRFSDALRARIRRIP